MVPASVMQSMPSLPPPAPLFSAARGPREETRRWTLAFLFAGALQAALVGVVAWSAGHGPSVTPGDRPRDVEVVFQAHVPRPAPAPAPAPTKITRHAVTRSVPAPVPVAAPPPPAGEAPPPMPEIAAPSEPVAPWDLALVGTVGEAAQAVGVPAGQGDPATTAVGSATSPAGEAERGKGAGGDGVDLEAYGTGLSRAVTSQRRYPPQARRLRLEGTVLVEVDVARDGSLAGEPVVSRSSGHALLDEEALRMVRSAAPFPALPGAHPGSSAHFVLPVRFGIRD